jgi:D-glycero-alpha-D-manno-heptose-7-phosphate kinase
MLIRARAPLRIGLAGGGTDVSPYCELYGGAVLNATISLFAYATIKPLDSGKIVFNCIDRNLTETFEAEPWLNPQDGLRLLKGVYNRIVSNHNDGNPLSFELTTYVDAPPGSGLGSSSTLVVAIVSAFSEWLKLPLGDYEIAQLAFEIERIDLKLSGGRQDQYAATFGGVNFIEFYEGNRVIVNPLRIKPEILNELQFRLLLYYTGTSRLSSKIIDAQIKNVVEKKETPIEAMHKLKEQAYLMKEAILKNRLDEVGELLDFGWQYKKKMAEGITNPLIEEIYETAKKAGALGGKISGAGGGGFMVLYCPNNTRYRVIEALQKFGGEFRRYQFTNTGVETWRID